MGRKGGGAWRRRGRGEQEDDFCSWPCLRRRRWSQLVTRLGLLRGMLGRGLGFIFRLLHENALAIVVCHQAAIRIPEKVHRTSLLRGHDATRKYVAYNPAREHLEQ